MKLTKDNNERIVARLKKQVKRQHDPLYRSKKCYEMADDGVCYECAFGEFAQKILDGKE